MMLLGLLAVSALVGHSFTLPTDQLPGSKSMDTVFISVAIREDPEQTTTNPYDAYFPDYYILPSDGSTPPFGGDRTDEFLYPPRSYYVHWAQIEKEKDAWEC